MRQSFLAATLLLALISVARKIDPAPGSARIVGTVVDLNGKPLKNISVRAFLEETKMYMPTADTNVAGEFTIPELEHGTYDIFGENEADDYPNTALSFYPNEHPLKVTLERGATAKVRLILGPKAGALSGIVSDSVNGRAVIWRHALRFIISKVSDPTKAIEFDGPPSFRWLIPPGTEVTLEVSAECYKAAKYTDQSGKTTLRLESGEERRLNVQLERDAKCSSGFQTAEPE